MEKGTRVRVTGGRKHKGEVGTVFWQGPDAWREGGTRLGLHGDAGETLWVRSDYCEPVPPDDPQFQPPTAEEPDVQRGSAVCWRDGNQDHRGVVFWVGPSKSGPGVRLGIKHEQTMETIWRSARGVTLASEESDDLPF